MCGIVGFTNHIGNANEVIDVMMDRIRHRGPDAEGKYVDADIALGHRRLSIIDVSSSGDQPIFNEDGSMVIVFNGEIYNYRDIREKLIAAGHKFRTNTDTEVLIHGYEEYGEKLLGMLRGMFSFVIWDKNKRELFGARDFFGIKPMYYAVVGKTLMFGSEIKSFLAHPQFVKELNTSALENYLTFQYPVLLEPIRLIRPFPLREARTRVIVRWDFPVFTINSALVNPGSSRRQLNTSCSRSLIWSFIRPFSWPDNGDLFRSILENSILKSVSVFSYLISTPAVLQSE